MVPSTIESCATLYLDIIILVGFDLWLYCLSLMLLAGMPTLCLTPRVCVSNHNDEPKSKKKMCNLTDNRNKPNCNRYKTAESQNPINLLQKQNFESELRKMNALPVSYIPVEHWKSPPVPQPLLFRTPGRNKGSVFWRRGDDGKENRREGDEEQDKDGVRAIRLSSRPPCARAN